MEYVQTLGTKKSLFGTINLPCTCSNLRNNQPLLLHVQYCDTWSLCGNFQLLMPEVHVVAFDNIGNHDLKFFLWCWWILYLPKCHIDPRQNKDLVLVQIPHIPKCCWMDFSLQSSWFFYLGFPIWHGWNFHWQATPTHLNKRNIGTT